MPPTDPDVILQRIRELDAVQWSTPSPRTEFQILKLETDFEDITGTPCPEWPERKAQ